MSNECKPVVGQWYLQQETREMFRVVAIDGTGIEIQSFEGDITEIELDAWHDMAIEEVAAPEDWSGPYDEIEADDLGGSPPFTGHRDWRVSLEREVPHEEWRETCSAEQFE